MGLLDKWFKRREPGQADALYRAVVTRARQPHWYLEGAVPDTIDGRFDTIAAVLSMVLVRLERDPEGAQPGVALTEAFVDDMDGQLRQIGIGDITVGKHVGKMMSMLGGRLGAYREGLEKGALAPALLRNLYRGNDPGAGALEHVEGELGRLFAALEHTPLDALLAGRLP